jgi:hypothetical protein
VCQHLTVARVAEGLGVSWNTANDAVLAEGTRVLIEDPARFDGVTVIGVDEHVWRHTRRGDKFVTVIIDLTPVRCGSGRARLAGDALDRCRRRIQDTHGHRGRTNDPLYRARRTLHTGADLLTTKQKDRLTALFTADEHVQVEATWGIYQRMITAYREPDRTRGRTLMTKLIASVRDGVPRALTELVTPRADPEHPRRRRPGLLRPAPARPTVPPRPSTDASSTCVAPPSASATSPTTSTDYCSRAAASDPSYTLDCEEPVFALLRPWLGHGVRLRPPGVVSRGLPGSWCEPQGKPPARARSPRRPTCDCSPACYESGCPTWRTPSSRASQPPHHRGLVTGGLGVLAVAQHYCLNVGPGRRSRWVSAALAGTARPSHLQVQR